MLTSLGNAARSPGASARSLAALERAKQGIMTGGKRRRRRLRVQPQVLRAQAAAIVSVNMFSLRHTSRSNFRTYKVLIFDSMRYAGTEMRLGKIIIIYNYK